MKFWDHVTKLPNGCWEWDKFSGRGYGYLYLSGSWRYAHRVSWELHHGQIPRAMCVLHSCDNRKCVNPEHLHLGTRTDNASERDARGRLPIREDHPRAKLTSAQVKQIRAMYDSGQCTQKELAQAFGLGQAQISNIIRHLQWKE